VNILSNFPKPDEVIEIDLPKVAKRGLYITALSLIILLAIHFILEKAIYFFTDFISILLFIIGYVLLIVLHEFFHLLGFRVFAQVPWKRMVIGVNLKLGVAYATTDKLMSNKAIRKALLLPFWMTGVLPAVIGLYQGELVLIVLAALLIGGAVGDFEMYRKLKKLPDDWLIKDDPKLPKLYVYAPERVEKEVQ